jgi:hypothetical protein
VRDFAEQGICFPKLFRFLIELGCDKFFVVFDRFFAFAETEKIKVATNRTII